MLVYLEILFNLELLLFFFSDGEVEFKKGEGKDDSFICEDVVGILVLSLKRKRFDWKDGKDDKSED